MRISALLGLAGAALGAVVAVGVHFVAPGRFAGVYVFAGGSRRRGDFLSFGSNSHPAWTPMLPLWTVGGLLVGLLVAAASNQPDGPAFATRVRFLVFPAVLGAIMGVAAGVLVYLHGRTHGTFHVGFVALSRANDSAYNSRLDVTLRGSWRQWWSPLTIGGGLGLLAGVALGSSAVQVWCSATAVSASSPSGSTPR